MTPWREWRTDCADGWSHHGLATLQDGTVVGYHPLDRRLLFFDPAGAVIRSVACEATEAHDIAVASDGNLWVADCGNKLSLTESGEVYVDPPFEEAKGRVLLVDVDNGTTLRSIEQLGEGLFLPTGVAVDERGLWVADGYGSNRVHLIDHDGELLLSLDGFDCPHGILVDRRHPNEPRLYVAERGAHRLCVYDLDGRFVRHAGEGHLIAPCALASAGDRLYVADLVARVTVLDIDDRFVAHIGAGDASRDGWPNAMAEGRPVPPAFESGRFNSPHGITTCANGDVVVTEWCLGGRWVRFARDC